MQTMISSASRDGFISSFPTCMYFIFSCLIVVAGTSGSVLNKSSGKADVQKLCTHEAIPHFPPLLQPLLTHHLWISLFYVPHMSRVTQYSSFGVLFLFLKEFSGQCHPAWLLPSSQILVSHCSSLCCLCSQKFKGCSHPQACGHAPVLSENQSFLFWANSPLFCRPCLLRETQPCLPPSPSHGFCISTGSQVDLSHLQSSVLPSEMSMSFPRAGAMGQGLWGTSSCWPILAPGREHELGVCLCE